MRDGAEVGGVEEGGRERPEECAGRVGRGGGRRGCGRGARTRHARSWGRSMPQKGLATGKGRR